MALERWDATLREFAEAGGRTPTFEERRSALINIQPESFRHEVFFRLPAMQNDMVNGSQEEQDMACMSLRQQLQRMVEVTAQWSTLSGKGNNPAYHVPGQPHGEEPSGFEREANEDDEGWVLYNGNWIQKGKGKGKGKFDKGKGKGKYQRDPKDALCANCGNKGHPTAQCPKPPVPWEERPCHNCGEKGHLSMRCPKRTRKANAVEQAPAVHQMMVRWEPCREDTADIRGLSPQKAPKSTTGRGNPSLAEYAVEVQNRFSALADPGSPDTPHRPSTSWKAPLHS